MSHFSRVSQGPLSLRGFSDLRMATTGSAAVPEVSRKPGTEWDDPALADIIDRPDWTPAGSHSSHRYAEAQVVVWGEV